MCEARNSRYFLIVGKPIFDEKKLEIAVQSIGVSLKIIPTLSYFLFFSFRRRKIEKNLKTQLFPELIICDY